MKKLLAGMGMLLCVGAGAQDVVTNVWVTPGGGDWLAADADGVYTNWAGNLTDFNDVMGNVNLFTLNNMASIRPAVGTNVYSAGMCFRRPADVPAEDELTWYLRNGKIDGQDCRDFFFTDAVFGYFPLWVDARASLVLGSEFVVSSDTKLTLRKEGPGTVRVSRFFRRKHPGRRIEVAEGTVVPMVSSALAYTGVRVTDPAGVFVLSNYSSQVQLGSYAPVPGVPLSLEGNDLQMGVLESTVLPGEVTGTGRVSALVRTLYATNVGQLLAQGEAALAQTLIV